MKQCFLIVLFFLAATGILYGQGDSYYYKYQQQKLLSKDETRLSVKFSGAMSTRALQNALASAGGFDLARTREVGVGVYTATLRQNSSSRTATGRLITMPNVLSVHPLYRTKDEGAELYLTDEICVQFNGASLDEIDRIVRTYNLTVRRRLDDAPYYLFAVSKQSDALQVANDIALEHNVLFSHPNFYTDALKKNYMPTDRWFDRQFNLYNHGQRTRWGFGTPGADIKMIQAWDITRGNLSILVSVIDDGCDLLHEDISPSKRVPGYDFANLDPDVQPVGTNAHGTNTTGAIAADHNSIGIAGISPNSRIQMMKIFTDAGGGGTNDNLARAIDSARISGADILSNSWGYGSSDTNLVPVVREAIIRAKTLGRGGKGCVVVFAAGNTANRPGSVGNITFPGSMSEVITVGASSRMDEVSFYSPNSSPGTNNYIELTAPSHRAYDSQIASEGFEFWSTDISGPAGYNSGTTDTLAGDVAGNYDGSMGGTSAACPQVAGAAALLLAVNPNLTSNEVAQLLISTADTVGGYNYHAIPARPGASLELGYGRMNVYRALLKTGVNFGWVKGIITNATGGAPLAGVNVDFTTTTIPQISGSSSAAGVYYAAAQVDTPGTTANLTMRGRKFGFRDTLINVTITRNDTLFRNFAMTPAAGGTLAIHAHRSDASGIRANVHVIFAGTEVINDFTDSTTGNFSAPLPVGSYDVIVDPPSPYGTRTFNGTVISAGTTTNVDALVRPVVEPSPTAVRDTLVVGQNHAKTLTLTNTTGDPVPFRISDDNVLLKMSKPAVQEPIVRQREMFLPKNYVDRGTGGDQTSGAGGPDGFGYRWIDSDEPGGPAYSWVDIKAVGTQITTWTSGTGDDGFFTIPTFPGGFSFPFYGNTFTGIHIGTNGNVQFSAAGSTQYINDAIPTATVPNNAIYPFWDDLDVSTAGAGTIWYYYDAANSQFIVQWDTVSHYTGAGVQGRYTFEVILRPSGEIVCQYRSMLTTVNSSTIGVEDAAGTVGLPVVFNGAYMHDNLALRFYLPDAGWISENPTIGTLAPNSSSNITVTFDAAGLNSGTTYSANLIVDATHPDVSGSLLVPASLKVQLADSAVLILNKTTVTFPTTQINTTRQDTVTAHNGGVLPLNISSITRTNTDYAVTPASAVVAPGDSVRIFISYTPTAVGSDTGRVIILSNSQGTPRSDVILNGTCIAAPAIGVAPSAVADTLQVGQSHSKSFTITNTATPPANFLFVSLTESVPWLAVSPSADTLAPSEGGSFACQFNATGLAVGTYTTNVTIASNDPANPSTNVGITLRVVGAPVITVRPDSLVKAVLSGGSATDTVVIKNTGLSTLTWTMTDIPTTANRTQPNIHHGPELPKGSDDGLSSGPITDDQGGPDAFGYRWIDSDEPGGPVFNWIDISSTGTALDSSSAWVPTGTFRGGDEGYFTITLPFPFSYYGVSYTTMNIGTNGNLMFQLPTGNVFTNAAFPTAGDPIDNHMGAFWDDLEVRGPGKVYYGMSGTNFVVQYNQVCRFNSSVPNYTFEFILTPGGAWYYQYLTMGITGGTIIQATIGMENAGATIGLGVVHNAAYIHDNLAILIASDLTWLSETPTSGSLNPGDSVKVVVAFNGTGLPDGLYRGSLSITSNDPATPTKLVPVKFTVGTLGVSDINPGVPATFELSQNYPNPFNPTTRIEFALPTASSIRLSVYNILGQEVVTLASEQRPAGYHSIEWNGRDASGRTLSSGIYFYKLEASATSGVESFNTLKKMLLVK